MHISSKSNPLQLLFPTPCLPNTHPKLHGQFRLIEPKKMRLSALGTEEIVDLKSS